MQCDECSTSYVVDIEAVSDPLLCCLICQQGCHSFPNMKQRAAELFEVQNELPITPTVKTDIHIQREYAGNCPL